MQPVAGQRSSGNRLQFHFKRWQSMLMWLALCGASWSAKGAVPTGPSLVGEQVTLTVKGSGTTLFTTNFTVSASNTEVSGLAIGGGGFSGTITVDVTGNGMSLNFTGGQSAPGSLDFVLSSVGDQSAAGVVSVTKISSSNQNGVNLVPNPSFNNNGDVSITASFTSLGFQPTGVNISELISFTLVTAPTVITLPATVAGSSATLNGTNTPNGGTNALNFEYGLTTSYGGTLNVGTNVGAGTAVSATLTGLIPGATYHYRLDSVVLPTSLNVTAKGADQTFAIDPGTAVSLLNAGRTNNGTNLLNFTIPAGTNRLLVVAASGENENGNINLNISKVTYNSTAMTLGAKTNDVPDGGFLIDSIWYAALGDSNTASTVTIAVTTNSLTALRSIGAYVFQGVDQTNSMRNFTVLYQPYGNGSTSYITSSITLASTNGNLVLDLLDSYSPSKITPGTNQTTGFSGPGGFGQTYASSLKRGTNSTTMSWSTLTANETILIAADINQAPAQSSVPTVTTATQSAVTASSATLGGNVTSDGGVAVTDRGIVWGLSANPTTSDTKVANGSGTGSFSATVTGLPAATTIHVRAYAINSIGTAYGSDISFSTLSTNANLSNLVLSTGMLNPVFSSNTLSYTANAGSTSSITVTPTVAQANATVTVNTVTVVSGSPSGPISLNPGTNTITVVVTAQDGSTTKTYTIIVTRNSPPAVASNSSAVMIGEGSLVSNTGTFSDADGNATVTLSASVGTVNQNNGAGTWSWSFTPTDGPDQSQTVIITADDGIATNATTFALTVNNVAPAAVGQSLTTLQNIATNLLLSATDPGVDTITNWTITVAPTNGALSGTAPNLTYTPTHNVNGSDSFQFTATDSDGATGTAATVSITIIPVNQPPEPGADNITRVSNTRTAKVLKTALLANDSDPENDTLSITAVGSPTPAGATVVISGTFVVYTAPATNSGNGTYTYTVSDGAGGHTVTASVTVTEIAPPPSGVGPNAASSTTSGGNNILTFLAVPGNQYRIQYTTNTVPTYTWNEFNPLAIFTAPANGVITFVDTNPPPPARLYRAISHP